MHVITNQFTCHRDNIQSTKKKDQNAEIVGDDRDTSLELKTNAD